MKTLQIKPFEWQELAYPRSVEWIGDDPLGGRWRLFPQKEQYSPLGPSDLYGQSVLQPRYSMSLDAAKEWCHSRFHELIVNCLVQEE